MVSAAVAIARSAADVEQSVLTTEPTTYDEAGRVASAGNGPNDLFGDLGQRWVRKTLDVNADGTSEESHVRVHDAGQIVLDFEITGAGDAGAMGGTRAGRPHRRCRQPFQHATRSGRRVILAAIQAARLLPLCIVVRKIRG